MRLNAAIAALSTLSLLDAGPSISEVSQLTPRQAIKPKYVFYHYMSSIPVSLPNAIRDVTLASASGADAFALNIMSNRTVSMQTVKTLFAAAKTNPPAGKTCTMSLFLSFDMIAGFQTDPGQIVNILKGFMSDPCYFKVGSLPFVSTFGGARQNFGESSVNLGWQKRFKDAIGTPVYFVPDFDDGPGYKSVQDSSYFTSLYPAIDGLFTWTIAWTAPFPSTVDAAYAKAAKSVGKSYMMSLSQCVFKHNTYGDFWHNGDLKLTDRMKDILNIKPDFVELLTWNDFGEGHWFGTTDAVIEGYQKFSPEIVQQTQNMNHTGWLRLVGPFIKAYKSGSSSILPQNGAVAQGSMWYRQIFLADVCTGKVNFASGAKPDVKPPPMKNGEVASDLANVAVILSQPATIIATSGTQTKTVQGVVGLNAFSLPLGRGTQSVVIKDSTGKVLSQTSSGPSNSVCNDCSCPSIGNIYNYNYQTLAL